MANFTFNGYDNVVLENQIESVLNTKLDLNRFMTRDDSLALEPGMIKKIHRYKGTGSAEHLSRGDANSSYIDSGYTEAVYEISRSQSATRWYQDDLYNDPSLCDSKIKTLAESLINLWNADAVKEFNKTENTVVMSSYNAAEFADAIAAYANKHESQDGLFFLVDIALVPKIRKMLGDELRYTSDYIRTGALGDIYGVPVYASKAVPSGLMFLADNQAVRAFVKADTQVEQTHDIETKEFKVVATKYCVIALVDENRCIVCGKQMATPATITTAAASAKTIAGAASTGAKVTAYVNGVKTGTAATASSNAYSITADENLAAGDIVKVVAELDGFVKSIAEVEVQA